MTSFDTNVSNYTLSELMAIIGVEEIEPHEIVERTNSLYNRFKTKNPQMASFFKEIQSQLLQYYDGLTENDEEDENENYESSEKIVVEGFGNMSGEAVYPAGNKQISNWYENENLTQKDQNQVDKITNRQQKIGIFGNQHVPMNREQIATTDTFQLPVKQDSLNPNLKNTISRFVNLDSQFRQYTNGADSYSTSYTLDLSDTLKDTISMRVYSYQIPFSWYTIDSAYGNTCFWIIDTTNNVAISVPPGNYSQLIFVSTLIKAFTTAGFSNYPTIDGKVGPVYYNENNGTIQLLLNGAQYSNNGVTFTVSSTTVIMFYDFTGMIQCNNNCSSKTNHYFNNTLGWLMGYRLPNITVDPSGNPAPAILDLNGPKYLMLVIDDYNQNHVNNSLVSISQFSNTLKVPSYYSPDLPYICTAPSQQTNNLADLIAGVTEDSFFDTQSENPLNGLLIAGKYQHDYTPTQILLPGAPRTLTRAQLYTINQININRNNNTNYLAKAPTTSDILAILPIKTSAGVPTGSLLVDFSGSLQDNIRTYFGPVNIDRMAVKLLDDKGNILNLNGNDWCVTLVCDCLYQY
jgi:hypothetical protein